MSTATDVTGIYNEISHFFSFFSLLLDYMGLYDRRCSYSDCAKCIRNYDCKITEQCNNFYCKTILEPSCASESTLYVKNCLAERRERIRRRWNERENQKDRDFSANLHHLRPITRNEFGGAANFEEYMRLQEERDEIFLANFAIQKHDSFFSNLDGFWANSESAPNVEFSDGAFNIPELVSLLPTFLF